MAVTRLTPRRRIMVEAAQAGIPPWWIAYELGITVKAVQVVLAQERGKGEVVPKFPHGIGWAAKRTKDAEASFYARIFRTVPPVGLSLRSYCQSPHYEAQP